MDFKKFDEDFERQHKRFNIMFAATSVFIALVWVAIFALAYFGITQISKHGLKGVIERVWNGNQ